MLNKITANKTLYAIILLVSQGMFSGCFHRYYQKTTLADQEIGRIQKTTQKLDYYRKTILIYQHDSGYLLVNFKIDTTNKIISGNVKPANPSYIHFSSKKDGRQIFYREDKRFANDQIGIYVKDAVLINNGEVSIPIDSISKIVMLESNYLKTGASYGIPSVFIAAGGFVGILAILCNCPYVYTGDSLSYNFTGVMFPGAVYKSVERNDFLKLNNLDASPNSYQFKIMNLKKEHQYTNQFELMIVNHEKGINVLNDKEGVLHTYGNLQAPIGAVSSGTNDHLKEVTAIDNTSYAFNDPTETDPLNSLILTFTKPKNSNTSKLVVNAKNTDWSGYAYNEICKLLGEKYEDWVAKQTQKPSEEIKAGSVKQGIPLSVYLKTSKGWEFIDYYNLVGTMASRDLIMPIDLSKIEGDTFQIMLKSGFYFWELNAIGIDYSADKKVSVDYLKPLSAIDSLGVDHVIALLDNDTNYLIHYNISDYVIVKFDSIPKNNTMNQTVFIHSKGYYNRTETYTGKPHYKELMKVKKPGGFSVFSRKKYFEIQNFLNATNAKSNGN